MMQFKSFHLLSNHIVYEPHIIVHGRHTHNVNWKHFDFMNFRFFYFGFFLIWNNIGIGRLKMIILMPMR